MGSSKAGFGAFFIVVSCVLGVIREQYLDAKTDKAECNEVLWEKVPQDDTASVGSSTRDSDGGSHHDSVGSSNEVTFQGARVSDIEAAIAMRDKSDNTAVEVQ